MKSSLELMDDIFVATHKGALAWHRVANEKHAQQIYEPWNVMRQFETAFTFNGNAATLICVEKRVYIYEYLFPHEDRMCELLILVDGEVVRKIGPPFLPWYWLSKFGDRIAKACNKPVQPSHV